MGPRVFFSYSSADQAIADKLVAEIERRGVPCWISSRDVRFGEDYQSAIVAALRESGVVLLLFSENANKSLEIPRELSLASKYKKTVIPARVQDIVPSDSFQYQMTNAQFIDLFRDFDSKVESLCVRLAELLQISTEVGERLKLEKERQAADALRQEKLKSLRRIGIGVAALFILGAGAAAGVHFLKGRSKLTSAAQAQPEQAITSAGSPVDARSPAGPGSGSTAVPSDSASTPLATAAVPPPVAIAPASAAPSLGATEMLKTAIAARGKDTQEYAPGEYMGDDKLRYVLSGPGVSLSDKISWTLQRASDQNQPAYAAVWTSGPALSNPDLLHTKAASDLPDGYEFGVVGINGRMFVVGVRQFGDAVQVTLFGDPNATAHQAGAILTLRRSQ